MALRPSDASTTTAADRRSAGPRRVDAVLGPWPLHDEAATRAAEAAALATSPPHALMARAGLATARLALARWPGLTRVDVFTGSGNNGGDGWVAATHLHRQGLDVRVHGFGAEPKPGSDAAWARALAAEAGVPSANRLDPPPVPRDAVLVVDALLGLGLRRAPEGAATEGIGEIGRRRAAGQPVLAVDLPSGLSADTGQPPGAVVEADATLTLLTLKPGLFTGHGRDLAGEVWFDDLGVTPAAPTALLAGPPRPAQWPHATHKGSRGDVIVVGGARGMTGAAWLAARAALAAGGGRVYASLLDAEAPALDAQRPELMARPAAWTAPPEQLAACTVVCGCGGAAEVRTALPALLVHAGRLVLDADALNRIAVEPALQSLLRARGAAGRPTILTPHPLEAARLLRRPTAEVQADRLHAASALAAMFDCAVVLKGSGSVIAAPGALLQVNPTGNAALATAGTGDVLAGWIGGLWAGRPTAVPAAVAAAAVFEHGRAADLHVAAKRGVVPLRAADLIESMAAAGR